MQLGPKSHPRVQDGEPLNYKPSALSTESLYDTVK